MGDEPVDPTHAFEEKCKETECTNAVKDYEACIERLPKYNNPKLTCYSAYIDMWHCIDHCAKPKVWATLK
eukprot:NODE_3179_length_482_cov_427.916859_g2760_i0.p1 GENE.NODE_3179_length_482_cov_427.916859_g2760_i0~~NODE_3179_length_482_cov_427.916859_g2760_i0.p1  ORF type:complete len:77 (+),score=19.66 NODE_3179_length_482_cov_427.916859_g2760_i0:23-232(+)